MDLTSLNPSFGVVASNGGTFNSMQTTGTSTASVSVPILPVFSASSLHDDRVPTAEISMHTHRRPNSYDFAEQIRQLQIEGNKLRSATVCALSQGIHSLNNSGLQSPEHKLVTSPLTSSIASLVDISAEQKTISDLRAQLENQRRETERLQSHLLGDVGRSLSNHAKPVYSTIPAADLSSVSTSRRAFEFGPPSHMERALKDSQEQVVELRKKLQEALESVELQKRQFKMINEELKNKLHETILNRDTVLDLRQKESAGQEALICKLQTTLTQLQEKCQAQEKILAEMNRQAENSSQSSYAMAMALSQLRALLAARERSRGRPFLDGDPAGTSQSMAALILTVEKCLQELEQETDSRRHKVTQLEKELELLRNTSYEKEQALIRDYQERLRSETEDALRKVNSVTSEQDRRLEEANERATNARKQAVNLQEQLHLLQEQQSQQSRMKNETIIELEAKLKQLKQDYEDDRSRWHERRQALEMSLDDVQRELIQAKAEKAEAVRNQAAADTKAEDFQMMVSHLETDLETERDRVRSQRDREEELRMKVLSLEGQITHKQQEMERLERMLQVVKQEASVQMHDRVINIEKQERDRYMDQISHLTSQLTTANETKMKLAVENERARMEVEVLRKQLNDLRLDLQSVQTLVDAARSEREHAQKLMQKAQDECQREHEEREHYRRVAEQKLEEAEQLRSTVERVTAQLQEKEKVLSTVRQQSTSISQLMEVNNRTSDNMREERERLAKLLETKTTALEESRAAQDAMAKKLRLREKRMKELEEETLKITKEMGTVSQEASLLQQEKENIFAELKESRIEVSKVTEAKDSLKRDMIRLKTSHAKELDKLQKRLKEAERDFKLTHKALKTKDSFDSKAVKVADQIQKEITAKRNELDNLRSKVRRLEEKMETLTKEKLMVERDKDSLKASLARSLLHTTQLTEELEASHTLTAKMQKRNKELEDALEKEAIKCSSTEAQLEQFDQEVATLKLKHQLDLKEATQLSQKTSQIAWVPIKDSSSGKSSERNHPALDANRKNSSNNGSAFVPKPGQMMPKMNHSMKGVQESYAEAGKELKSMLAEMKELIQGQREINRQTPSTFSSVSQSSPLKAKSARRRSRSNSPDRHQQPMSGSMYTEGDPSFSTPYPLHSADVSALSAATVSRSSPSSPRRAVVNGSTSWCTDITPRSSCVSRDSPSDTSNLSISFSSPVMVKGGSAVTLVPDTQELCRRLEEKIANLTRMGSNLQHENQEMAQLISVQGQKLEVVRKNERQLATNKR